MTAEIGNELFKARATQVYNAERDRLFSVQSDLMPFFSRMLKKASPMGSTNGNGSV